MFCDVVIV
jgi:hypothetical protein